MIRHAQVVEVAPTGEFVNVVLENASQCRQCARGKGCGAMLMSTQSENDKVMLRCRSDIVVQPGQAVIIDIEGQNSQWLWPVFGAFGLPLAGMLLATVFASVFFSTGSAQGTSFSASGQSALVEVVAAIGGLAAGIWLWRRLAPAVLARVMPGLCLDSARIVSTKANAYSDYKTP